MILSEKEANSKENRDKKWTDIPDLFLSTWIKPYLTSFPDLKKSI